MQAARLQDGPDAAGDDPLPDARDDPAGDQNVLHWSAGLESETRRVSGAGGQGHTGCGAGERARCTEALRRNTRDQKHAGAPPAPGAWSGPERAPPTPRPRGPARAPPTPSAWSRSPVPARRELRAVRTRCSRLGGQRMRPAGSRRTRQGGCACALRPATLRPSGAAGSSCPAAGRGLRLQGGHVSASPAWERLDGARPESLQKKTICTCIYIFIYLLFFNCKFPSWSQTRCHCATT